MGLASGIGKIGGGIGDGGGSGNADIRRNHGRGGRRKGRVGSQPTKTMQKVMKGELATHESREVVGG